MWYLCSTLPSAATISIAGCFFSSGESTMMSRERPVTSSTSSWTVTLSMMSLKRTVPLRFGEDRERVRIPLDEDLALLDVLAVAHLEARAVDDRIALADDALVVHDVDRAAAVHDDERPAGRRPPSLRSRPFDRQQAVEPDRAVVPRLERRLLGDARRRAADVERPHRQLRAGLADRLRRDDADRQPELDQPSGRQVAAVALRAHAAARRARQHRPDLDALDARVLDRVGQLLVELARRRHDDLRRTTGR